jgi:competence protein ComGC
MQIVLFLIFILLLILVFAIKKDELSTKSKVTIIVTILVAILISSVYEFSKESQSKENRIKVNAFLQDKALECSGVIVTKEGFEYISGTQVFMPKKENYEHKGLVLEVSKCTIKSE